MSRFKHQMGMARLRVRGMAKVTYVAMLRALGLNIHRVAVYRTAVGEIGRNGGLTRWPLTGESSQYDQTRPQGFRRIQQRT